MLTTDETGPSTRVLRTESEGLVTLTFNGPRLSALDVELLTELRDHLASLGTARGVLLTGSGRAFSAGLDLHRVLDGGADYTRLLLRELDDAVRELSATPIPVVAALNGHAIAGGCVLALAADVRIASLGRIGLNELAIGVPFPPSALSTVQRVLGHRAEKVILAAELLSAEEALAQGLVDEVVPAEDLARRARTELHRLAQIPSETFAVTKRALRAACAVHTTEEELLELAAIWTSPSMLERMASVLK